MEEDEWRAAWKCTKSPSEKHHFKFVGWFPYYTLKTKLYRWRCDNPGCPVLCDSEVSRFWNPPAMRLPPAAQAIENDRRLLSADLRRQIDELLDEMMDKLP